MVSGPLSVAVLIAAYDLGASALHVRFQLRGVINTTIFALIF